MSNKDKGFASMDKTRQRELASKGGKAAHKKGTAHEWNSETARVAGRKGGMVSRGGRGRVKPADVALPFESNIDVGADVPGGGAV